MSGSFAMSSLNDCCPFCGNYNLQESLEDSNSVHYGRVICGECDRFIRWLPKPKVPEISVVRLLHCTGLEPWERKFLKTIACRNPTKAEIVVIEAIHAKVNPVPSGRGTG